MDSLTKSRSNSTVTQPFGETVPITRPRLRPLSQRTRQGLFLLLLALLPSWGWAQEPPEAAYPYRRDLEKFKFERAEEKLIKHLRRDSNDLEFNYAAYRLYSTPAFTRYNTDTAYRHLVVARRTFDIAEAKMIERWARDSYSGALFDYSFRRVTSMALADARTINTPDIYRHFLEYYTQAPDDIRDSAVRFRDTVEYDLALRAGTIQMVEDFIARRPQSLLLSQAVHHRDSMVFNRVEQAHTVAAYRQYRIDYPNSHLFGRATDSLYLLDYRETRHLDSEKYYRSYAERYPQSPYSRQAVWYADSIEYHRDIDTTQWYSLVQYADLHHRNSWYDTALNALTRFALSHRHLNAAHEAARRLSSGTAERADIALLLHDAYLHTSVRNFARFYRRYPDLMSKEMRQKDSVAYVLNQNYDFQHADDCIRAIAPAHEAYLMLQQLLKDDIVHGRFLAAKAKAESYAAEFSYSYEYLQLLSTLSTEFSLKNLKTRAPQPLAGNVNSARGDEYGPIPGGDGNTLYFTATNRPESIGGEDVFVSHLSKKGWSKPSIVMDLSHTYGNEAPAAVTPDDNTLLLFQSGLLHLAERTAEGWDVTQLPQAINGFGRITDATLGANGRVLIFTARGRTDREVDSSLNIYVSLMDDKGQWSNPFEIGADVNTAYDERSPYLHPDMRTLYFSSEGHGSLGQMDVFMTTRLDDSYTRWSTPVNIGHEINTVGDDWGYTVSVDGKTCFFSRQDDSQDLYSVPMPANAQPQPVVPVSGIVKDPSGHPVATKLQWHDPVSGRLLGQCSTHPTKGTFYLLLPLGAEYQISVADRHYRADRQTVDLTPSAPDDKAPNKLTITAMPIENEETQNPQF